MADVKVLIGEKDGVELGLPEEHLLLGSEVPVSIPGFTSTDAEGAIEESTTLSGVARMPILFGYDGNATNGTYLQTFKGVASNTGPFVVAETGEITSLSVAFKTNSTVTFEVFVNGSSQTDLIVTSNNRGTKVGLAIPLSINNEISVQLTSGSCRDVAFWVNIKTSA